MIGCGILNYKKIFSLLITITICCCFAARFCTYAEDDITPKIIIDAGHGGFDGGAVAADGTFEKDINLQVALKLRDIAEVLGYKTVMTRETDKALCDTQSSIRKNKVEDMHNRLKIIDDNRDGIYIGIHMNKFEQPQVHGAQVFYSPNNENSQLLAENIQNSIATYVQKDNKRVVKKAGKDIFLLKNARQPAVLAECGFVSNGSELQNLKNSEYQTKIAFAIVLGAELYYN